MNVLEHNHLTVQGVIHEGSNALQTRSDSDKPEIAIMLNCAVGTSKSQLHKARMKLRKLLTR